MRNMNYYTEGTPVNAEDVCNNLMGGGELPADWEVQDAPTGPGTPTWAWAAEYAEHVINWDGETPVTDDIVSMVVFVVADRKASYHVDGF